jgi:hypothetical protein
MEVSFERTRALWRQRPAVGRTGFGARPDADHAMAKPSLATSRAVSRLRCPGTHAACPGAPSGACNGGFAGQPSSPASDLRRPGHDTFQRDAGIDE